MQLFENDSSNIKGNHKREKCFTSGLSTLSKQNNPPVVADRKMCTGIQQNSNYTRPVPVRYFGTLRSTSAYGAGEGEFKSDPGLISPVGTIIIIRIFTVLSAF